jgi:hypothetical protein
MEKTKVERRRFNIKSIRPYYRGSRQVEKMKAGLPLMILNNGIFLPTVRPAPNLSKSERDKPITITKETTDKNKEIIEQWITISYSNDKNMGAPSHRWYDIQMALFEELQKNGYNDRVLRIDSLNRIRKRIGSNLNTVIDDLRKSVGITINSRSWFPDMKRGLYRDYTGRLFAHFEQIRTANGNFRGAYYEFDEYYFNYIQNNLLYTNRVYDTFFELDSTVAKILMQRLLRQWSPKLPPSEKPYIWRRDLKQLGVETALTTDSISNLTKNFNKAGDQLREIGFIKNKEVVKESKTESGRRVEFVYNWRSDPWKGNRITNIKLQAPLTDTTLKKTN